MDWYIIGGLIGAVVSIYTHNIVCMACGTFPTPDILYEILKSPEWIQIDFLLIACIWLISNLGESV